MKIQQVLNGVEINKIYGELPEEILYVTDNSKKVKKGSLFICRRGNDKDGSFYISEAISNGAVMVIAEKYTDCQKCFAEAEDIVEATTIILQNFYSNPQRDLKIIGLVGTNGKTSTCRILSEIIERSGQKTGVIGTIGNYIGDKRFDSELTTPGLVGLYELLYQMRDENVKYVIMEVSAHAIAQKRTNGIFFEALVFTNCTEDHLDYFKTFEEYSSVKKSIFCGKNAKYLIVNVDDETGREIARTSDGQVVTYALFSPSDCFAIDIKENPDGIEYTVNLADYVSRIKSELIGIVNVYNSLAAATCAVYLGVDADIIAMALKEVKRVEGRSELVATYNGAYIYVDYAHTPDGLEQTLKSMRKICKNKLYSLFGCGGNRETAKRSIMGKISAAYADFTIITDDNPRYEEPADIRKEIEKGVKDGGGSYVNVSGRSGAIKYAMKMLKEGDILLVAGKGAEKYQEINGVKMHFSDVEEIIKSAEKIEI